MWTLFWDMHSGGRRKETWHHIYIEAPREEAEIVFYNRFGHNPNRVSCTCCGEDYSIRSHESLQQLSGFHRNCRALATPRDPETGFYKNDDPVIQERLYLEDGEEPPEGYEVKDRVWGKHVPFEEWVEQQGIGEDRGWDTFKLIYATDIQPEERKGDIPEQGYVWID